MPGRLRPRLPGGPFVSDSIVAGVFGFIYDACHSLIFRFLVFTYLFRGNRDNLYKRVSLQPDFHAGALRPVIGPDPVVPDLVEDGLSWTCP